MRWEDTRELPWGTILLFGGGFALAEAFFVSGLAEWFGAQLRGLLRTLPTRIRSEEADILDDTRHLAVAFRTGSAEIENVRYDKMDTTERVDTRVLQELYSFDPAGLPVYVGQQMDVYNNAPSVAGMSATTRSEARVR
jgi:hypothetical protein